MHKKIRAFLFLHKSVSTDFEVDHSCKHFFTSTADLAANMAGTFLNLVNVIFPGEEWISDMGCNDHMTSNFSKLIKISISCASPSSSINLLDGNATQVTHIMLR